MRCAGERFVDMHGPDARPCYGDLRADDPEVEAANRSKLTFDFFVKREVPVFDARSVASDLELDRHGVCLRHAPTAMAGPDFYDQAKVDSVYLQECREYIMRETGATAVLPFDSTVRNRDPSSPAAGYAENRPHNDHTLLSGPRRTRELLGEDPVNDVVLEHRFAIVNVWRRWDGGDDWPLACCTYDRLDYQRDMQIQDLVYPHRTGETYTVRAESAPSHQYLWFSGMNIDEGILLKIFDSDDSASRGSLHTGFENEAALARADPARESMEVRCIVLWAPEELAGRATLRGVASNVGEGKRGPSGHDNDVYRASS